VRFICGTFSPHLELEKRIAAFMGTQASYTFVSCWKCQRGGVRHAVRAGDMVISDELNHASIIDADPAWRR